MINESKTMVIESTEYQSQSYSVDQIPEDVAKYLWINHSHQILLQWPTPMTNNAWVLTPQGWVGHIPVTDEIHVLIKPKVELSNLFRMLEYAYKLDFQASGDLINSMSLEDFYERLASIFARRILDRARKGIYREYQSRQCSLPYVRGRVWMEDHHRYPWLVDLDCRYDEHSADIEDNQIIAWTLYCIAQSGLCGEIVSQTVRKAYRVLQGFTSLAHFPSSICLGRCYNRLNDDYRPLHALCCFFLEQSGPSHELGNHRMIPFLIDMDRLFEIFVAEWLQQHLPPHLELRTQEKFNLTTQQNLHFRIDLVIVERSSQRPICVLDTKYKIPDYYATSDFSQVVSYAEAMNCHNAFLVYPSIQNNAISASVGHISVDCISFSLDGDLENNGLRFLASIQNRV